MSNATGAIAEAPQRLIGVAGLVMLACVVGSGLPPPALAREPRQLVEIHPWPVPGGTGAGASSTARPPPTHRLAAHRDPEPSVVNGLTAYERELNRALRFDEADVAANRGGSFSIGQLVRRMAWILGWGLATALLAYTVFALLTFRLAETDPPWKGRLLRVGGVLVGALLMLPVMIWQLWRFSRDLLPLAPCQASGTLTAVGPTSAGRTGQAWQVSIDERRFRGPRLLTRRKPDELARVDELARIGEPHRAYFGCTTEELLGLEALSPGEEGAARP